MFTCSTAMIALEVLMPGGILYKVKLSFYTLTNATDLDIESVEIFTMFIENRTFNALKK